MGFIIPSSQASGKVPVSSIKLKKDVYNGSIMWAVLFIYSLIIASFAHALLFFNNLIHFRISESVIGEFKISSLSSIENSILSSQKSFSISGCSLI